MPPPNGGTSAPRLFGANEQKIGAQSQNLYRGAGKSEVGLQLNEHFHEAGDVIFRHACKLGCEGIVSKRLGSRYRSGRSPDWLKSKNPEAPAVKREVEEDWGRRL